MGLNGAGSECLPCWNAASVPREIRCETGRSLEVSVIYKIFVFILEFYDLFDRKKMLCLSLSQTQLLVLLLCIHFPEYMDLKTDPHALWNRPLACTKFQTGLSNVGQRIHLAKSLSEQELLKYASHLCCDRLDKVFIGKIIQQLVLSKQSYWTRGIPWVLI